MTEEDLKTRTKKFAVRTWENLKRTLSNKLRIVLEEADESAFWLEFIKELGIHSDENELQALHKEAVELTKIFTASIRTAERSLNS